MVIPTNKPIVRDDSYNPLDYNSANKNMVPFDDKSPFITSGIRFGTAAVTTRGLKENDMKTIVDFIDQTITNHENENLITKIKSEVNEFMSDLPLFTQ